MTRQMGLSATLGFLRLRGVGINSHVSLSWYCDWAVGEVVEAEPEEAAGDDILFCCLSRGLRQGTVRSLKSVDGAYNAS